MKFLRVNALENIESRDILKKFVFINYIEITNNMQLFTRIYYSNVY